MSESPFTPDLGEADGVTAPLKDGLRAKAERTFIEMIRAAFQGHETFPYDDDPEKRRLEVRSALSSADEAFLPRVEVRVGPISEYEGSINNLNKWTKAVQRHLYADQAQVMFICTAEESAEANALGDRTRRLIDLARQDLGRRGIFGMMKPKMQVPKPARKGGESNDVYQAAVQSGFVIVERQERQQDTSNPEYGGVSNSATYETGSGIIGNFQEEDLSGPSPASVVSAEVEQRNSTEARLRLTFSNEMGTYQVDGLSATVGQETRSPPVVRDSRNFKDLIVEISGVQEGTPISVSYAPGNLEDNKGRFVQAFGPVEAQWI